jgi:hypothetical protein
MLLLLLLLLLPPPPPPLLETHQPQWHFTAKHFCTNIQAQRHTPSRPLVPLSQVIAYFPTPPSAPPLPKSLLLIHLLAGWLNAAFCRTVPSTSFVVLSQTSLRVANHMSYVTNCTSRITHLSTFQRLFNHKAPRIHLLLNHWFPENHIIKGPTMNDVAGNTSFAS